MGKYIRKRRAAGAGAGTTTAPAVVVAGVRTRSRSAAAAEPAPKRARKALALTRAADGAAEGCCYLQLRSRRLFFVADEAAPAAPLEAGAFSTASVEAVAVAGASRCSSAASSVDVVAAPSERSGCAEAKPREDCDVESSVSDSSCCRDRREATPSSRPPGDVSDRESSQAADGDGDQIHLLRKSAATATTTACRTRMPLPEEIEEFFAAAEKAEAERFAAKYNFDVVRGAPLDAGSGRFEWTPVPSG